MTLGEVSRPVKELYGWLPILGIVLVFWLLVLRPATRRQRALRQFQGQIAVGDEVITNAGIFGRIVRIDDDRVGLEVAEGVVITLARPAIVGLTSDDETDDAPGDPGDDTRPAPTDDTANEQE
jgi:preprotein translocase subunit YajC